MDLRKLKTLIDLVSESNVSELEITEARGKVRIVKSEGVVHQQYVAASHAGSPIWPPRLQPLPRPSPQHLPQPLWKVMSSNRPWLALSTALPALVPRLLWMWAARSRKATRSASLKP